MNVLLYNFKQPEAGGGGVGVYSTNLAHALRAAGHRVVTMDAGDRYSLLPTDTVKIKAWRDIFDRVSVINSPMIAPFFFAWQEFGRYTEPSGLTRIPADLRSRFGPIDVFHFQNVEGLTMDFFVSLREEFPDARLIYSAHNYSAVCPQVDLWFQERQVCSDYRDGLNCTRCFPPRESSVALRASRRRRFIVEFFNNRLPSVVNYKRQFAKSLRTMFRPHAGMPEIDTGRVENPHDAVSNVDVEGPVFSFPPTDGDGTPYRDFRRANIELCAGVFDTILAVSGRTRQVLIDRGLSPHNVHVSYIGTAHKAIFDTSIKVMDVGEQLSIAYLGYMRSSKGFYLFLSALEKIPEDFARTIVLTVAARKKEDPAAYDRLTKVAARFSSFRYFDGFTHQTLDNVLLGVNLGIVPPIWEDNLPQVAIEIVSRGIPVLTSDRGGAQEIADNPDFRFSGASASQLGDRIVAICKGEIPLGRFWEGPIKIFSMEEHLDDVLRYYRPRASPGAARPKLNQKNEAAALS